VKKIKKLLLFGLLLRITLALFSSYHPDILNHVDWGNRFWQYGPREFYEGNFWSVSWPNQPLASILLFALISKLNQFVFSFLWFLNTNLSFFPSFIFPFLEKNLHIFLLKLPFILSDLGLAYLAHSVVLNITKNQKKALLACFLFLFNPVLVYNSAVWGQTDSLINLLALIGIWKLYQKSYILAFFSLFLCLYFKLSLLIWSPVVLLLIWQQKKYLPKILASALLVALIFTVLTLPFVQHNDVFTWLWYLYNNRILPRQGNMLSGNAFNFWTLLFGQDLSLSQDLLILGLKAKIWGFLVTLSLIFLPLIKIIFQKEKLNSVKIFNLLFLVSFSTFLFMTNMHERYLYPIFFPLLILVCLQKVNLKYYLYLSLVHFLNLYNLWWYPSLPFLKKILESYHNFLPRVLSLSLLSLFVVFYVKYLKKENV
jgi:dolichyl-phosphate-mannose-protein mannosyltransferase